MAGTPTPSNAPSLFPPASAAESPPALEASRSATGAASRRSSSSASPKAAPTEPTKLKPSLDSPALQPVRSRLTASELGLLALPGGLLDGSLPVNNSLKEEGTVEDQLDQIEEEIYPDGGLKAWR